MLQNKANFGFRTLGSAPEWRYLDPGSAERLANVPRDFDRAGCIAVNTDRVRAHLDDFPGHRNHLAVPDHPHHAIGYLPGLMQHSTSLAARYQRAVILIRAVGEHFVHHRQVGRFSSANQL